MKCFVDGCNKKRKSRNTPCIMHYTRMIRYGTYYKRYDKCRPIVFEESEKGCFLMTSHISKGQRYPRVKHKGIRTSAHRKVYEEMFGDIPEGLIVRHKCDEPTCINPEHLELGTNKDNSNDMVKRGRSMVGEKCSSAVLTEKEVIEIRSFGSQFYQYEIAELYGVSKSAINRVFSRETWKHI